MSSVIRASPAEEENIILGKMLLDEVNDRN
jgi:hypothetical protein